MELTSIFGLTGQTLKLALSAFIQPVITAVVVGIFINILLAILLALGMMMLSSVTISLPFKLFLFVAVDGWTELVQGLVLSYQIP